MKFRSGEHIDGYLVSRSFNLGSGHLLSPRRNEGRGRALRLTPMSRFSPWYTSVDAIGTHTKDQSASFNPPGMEMLPSSR